MWRSWKFYSYCCNKSRQVVIEMAIQTCSINWQKLSAPPSIESTRIFIKKIVQFFAAKLIRVGDVCDFNRFTKRRRFSILYCIVSSPIASKMFLAVNISTLLNTYLSIYLNEHLIFVQLLNYSEILTSEELLTTSTTILNSSPICTTSNSLSSNVTSFFRFSATE